MALPSSFQLTTNGRVAGLVILVALIAAPTALAAQSDENAVITVG